MGGVACPEGTSPQYACLSERRGLETSAGAAGLAVLRVVPLKRARKAAAHAHGRTSAPAVMMLRILHACIHEGNMHIICSDVGVYDASAEAGGDARLGRVGLPGSASGSAFWRPRDAANVHGVGIWSQGNARLLSCPRGPFGIHVGSAGARLPCADRVLAHRWGSIVAAAENG